MSAKAPLSVAMALGILLVGCAGQAVPPKPAVDTSPRLRATAEPGLASFDCSGALPAVHRQICADETLAQLDRQLISHYHRLRQELDPVGSMLLTANHRQWLLSRGEQCRIDNARGPDEQAIACLGSLYRKRSREMDTWAAARVAPRPGRNAWTSYVEYRLVDDQDSACRSLEQELNQEVSRHGIPSPARLDGVRMLAGTHARQASAEVGGQRVGVELYNPGVYAGYQNRARSLSVNGQPLLDDATLAHWIARQPNYGGRAHAASSQTGDYAAIDVFQRNGRDLVLVNETWGYYSPAARGESAFAGLYALQGGQLQPLCLYQSYLTPPRTNTLAGLTLYPQLQEELDKVAGRPHPALAQHERRDNFEGWKETQWTLLNLPLLAVDALQREGWEGALRQRHDAALEQLFQWSEQYQDNKDIYRRLLPLMQPVLTELQQLYAGQGLDSADARTAAELLLHETLARAVEALEAPTEPVSMPLAAGSDWQPRYALAPAPGDLERNRRFDTLYSVVLNNAPPHVVADFIAYEKEALGARWGRGADNTPATLAAVARIDNLRQLLDAGMPVDEPNRWGRTALMAAAEQDQADSVRLLLDRGANVHSRTRMDASAGQADQDGRTALLLAARHAGPDVIDQLVAAGALRQAWNGYDQQVCGALEGNGRLDQTQRERLRVPLCGPYAPLPAAERQKTDLRGGEVLLLTSEGVDYRITLREREPALLFGRTLQTSATRMDRDMRSMAVRVGTAAAHRAKLQLAGPLTLHIPNLMAQTADSTQMFVAYPVASSSAYLGGYSLIEHPAATVLSITFDSNLHEPAATWRALYQAALEQGLQPRDQAYVMMHTRGQRVAEYQLVVSEPGVTARQR